MKTGVIILGIIALSLLCWHPIKDNRIKDLQRENTQLKQEIIKANTTIEQANRILNNPDSTCIFIYSNPKHRRK